MTSLRMYAYRYACIEFHCLPRAVASASHAIHRPCIYNYHSHVIQMSFTCHSQTMETQHLEHGEDVEQSRRRDGDFVTTWALLKYMAEN